MRERDIQDAIRMEAQAIPGCVIWRNNNGAGIMVLPNEIERLISTVTQSPSQALGILHEIKRRNVNRFGLVRGASDLIGIGPGGVFLACEVKSQHGRLTEEQRLFLELVEDRGGIGVCASEVGVLTEAVKRRRL
jgi:hypothetical protein